MGGLHTQGMCCGEGPSSQTIQWRDLRGPGYQGKQNGCKCPLHWKRTCQVLVFVFTNTWTECSPGKREMDSTTLPVQCYHSAQEWIAKPISFMNPSSFLCVCLPFLPLRTSHHRVLPLCYDGVWNLILHADGFVNRPLALLRYASAVTSPLVLHWKGIYRACT